MIYNYYFCIAAIISTLGLAVIYFSKRSLSTRTNMLFLMLIVNNLIVATLDLISCFTVSYPENYPMFVNYLSNMMYLITYNAEAALFVLYIHSILRKNESFKSTIFTIFVIFGVEVLLIATTPLTHLIIYFDDALTYTHGPAMASLYIMAFSQLAIALYYVLSSRKQLSLYQYISLSVFIVSVFMCVIVQTIIPKLVIGEFASVLFLTLAYCALENPAYHRFRTTSCYNADAFFYVLRKRLRNNYHAEILAVNIDNYPMVQYIAGSARTNELSSELAEKLHHMYKENAFMISDRRFIVIISHKLKKSTAKVREEIREIAKSTKLVQHTGIDLVFGEHILSKDLFKGRHYDATLEEIFDMIFKDLHTQDGAQMHLTDEINATRHKDKVMHAVDYAIEHGSFEVYFQPIINLETGKFDSAEGLARLIDDEIGFIPPDEFITLAENTGRIAQVDEIIIRKTCEFLKSEKLIGNQIKYVELNLSAAQCMRDGMAEELLALIDSYHMPHDAIHFEITETFEMDQESGIYKNLNKLLAEGIEFAIDDFGSGYASMNYLTSLPATMIKIDKNILWEAMRKEQGRILLKNMIRMIRELKLSVLVEGAEDEDMVQLLKELGCQYIQGYYFSKPLPMQKYLDFLNQ